MSDERMIDKSPSPQLNELEIDRDLTLYLGQVVMTASSDFEHVKAIVDRALADQRLTREEQQDIMRAILADNWVSEEEQELLESIAERIRQGDITVVD